MDLDVTHRFVAKVALSAGYLVYGDHCRKHVKHEDFRKIMNQRPTEMGDLLKTIRRSRRNMTIGFWSRRQTIKKS
jgi:hypothetical protein